MYGLLSLYLGYIIYLIIFFRTKIHDPLYRKVTILLGVKLLLLTLIYASFFANKMTKEQRQIKLESLIINEK